MSLTIITPTIGSKYLKGCINSIKNQTNQNFIYYIVIDGQIYNEAVYNILIDIILPTNLKIITLDENTGSNGYNGHRIYISMGFLTNSEYIMFLDEDNTFESNHVETVMKNIIDNNLDWTFSLRNIIDKDGQFICQDKCESLGNLHHVWNNPNDFLVDTSCYCIKREIFIKHSLDFYKKFRDTDIEMDRALFKSLQNYKFESTNIYTVNYRVENTDKSVKAEFFIQGNKFMETKNKNLYVFHLNPNWTAKLISTNELDYDSPRYIYEDGNKTMLYKLKEQYNLIDGYRNNIPSKSICLFIILDIKLFPKELLERTDIKKICYLLEGPNSWHKDNYDYNSLNKYFDHIITYWEDLLEKPKINYFPFVSRFDISNKYHTKMIIKNRKYDKSIGMILSNRNNNETYQINDTELIRLDFLRKEFVLLLDNVTVHGQGWDDIKDHKYIKIENVSNRMTDETNIYDFYKRFNFALIVENCNGKNYVSEKIYDAWVAGCIPIYFGNNNKINLPKNHYIDINDFTNITELNKFINLMDNKIIDAYYDNINKNLEQILDTVSPNKLCEKILSLI
jgi:hypothetical protein